MKYLKLTNRMLGDCPNFRKEKGGIDWAKLECNPEYVRRLGFTGKLDEYNFVSVIPLKNEQNKYILKAIEDTNNNDFEEDTAELISSDIAKSLKESVELYKTSFNG